MAYVKRVRARCELQPEIYAQFLDTMQAFRAQTKLADIKSVIKRISTLFRDHDDLILGFQAFLPPGWTIDADGTGTYTAPDMVKAKAKAKDRRWWAPGAGEAFRGSGSSSGASSGIPVINWAALPSSMQ